MAVGAGEHCPGCDVLLQLDARWAKQILVAYAIVAIGLLWLVESAFSPAPVVRALLQLLLGWAALWGLASSPLQRRTHRLPVAQLVVFFMLLLIVLSAAASVLAW